ncbi:MAG: GntR family transcriptional regulator [Candidatus Accumulibacter sp.]|jgi:DNA-binding GntR family transcriptional regulator|nr:GntR family transcriptional regulator [Accumulibacter sp.]
MEANMTDTLSGNFRPQESLSIGAQLHRILRTAIIRGELLPGQAISEVEMSKKFNVSRQPVREAFIKLSEEHLIEILPQRGTYVRRISVKEVLDARHLREIIEVSVIREVTRGKTAALIETLRALVAEQRKIQCGDNLSYLRLDDEFHRALALHAGREYLWRVTEGIKAQMSRVRFLTFDLATPTPQLTDEHAEIVDAIDAGDEDRSVRRMERHLRTLIQSLPLVARRYPEHFTTESQGTDASEERR